MDTAVHLNAMQVIFPIREEFMAEVQRMRGEKIYELDVNITGVTDYGVTMDAILSGKEKVPLQGTRFGVRGSWQRPARGQNTRRRLRFNAC
jgi:hypothetical protein